MSYENNSANNPAQTAPKLMENLLQIPMQAYLLAAVLGMAAFGAIPWAGAILIICGGWIALNRIEALQKLRDAKAVAATYANCIGPIIVESMLPTESIYDVAARAEFWREQLRLSGNPIADIIPIIEMPYTPILTEYGQLGAGWSTYKRQTGERQHMENVKWYEGKCPAEYKTLFASAVLPPVKQVEQ